MQMGVVAWRGAVSALWEDDLRAVRLDSFDTSAGLDRHKVAVVSQPDAGLWRHITHETAELFDRFRAENSGLTEMKNALATLFFRQRVRGCATDQKEGVGVVNAISEA